jgi:hydroxyethylthiazole kinase
MLLEQVSFSAIRANATEIAALVRGTAAHRGVDADPEEAAADSVRENAKKLALETGAVVIATGDTDIVTDGKTLYRVHNGHPMMKTVTGSGCQLSVLTGAYVTANPGKPLQAALAAVCAMGLAGEIAHGRLAPQDGNASYRNYIIDAIYNLTPEALEKGARYETDS